MSKQTPISPQQALAVFQEQGGILKTGQARALGMHSHLLNQLVRNGLLEKISRGIYRLASFPPLDHPEWIITTLRAPNAVFCLQSALHFYGLTTEIPRTVHIALPKSNHPPKLRYPPLDVIYLAPRSHAAGIEQTRVDGIYVPITSPAKTVADCFKFRNKIGGDIAVAALRDYLRQRNFSSLDELLAMARINRVEKIMHPYIEALV